MERTASEREVGGGYLEVAVGFLDVGPLLAGFRGLLVQRLAVERPLDWVAIVILFVAEMATRPKTSAVVTLGPCGTPVGQVGKHVHVYNKTMM